MMQPWSLGVLWATNFARNEPTEHTVNKDSTSQSTANHAA